MDTPEELDDELENNESFIVTPRWTKFITRPDGQTVECINISPAPGGRPSLFDPDYHPQAMLEMANEGFSFNMMSVALGVTRKTLYNWCDAHPDLISKAHLNRVRRSSLELSATRNTQGTNKSKTAFAMLERVIDFNDDDELDGDEYKINDAETGAKVADALTGIAAHFAAQAEVLDLKKSRDDDDT